MAKLKQFTTVQRMFDYNGLHENLRPILKELNELSENQGELILACITALEHGIIDQKLLAEKLHEMHIKWLEVGTAEHNIGAFLHQYWLKISEKGIHSPKHNDQTKKASDYSGAVKGD